MTHITRKGVEVMPEGGPWFRWGGARIRSSNCRLPLDGRVWRSGRLFGGREI